MELQNQIQCCRAPPFLYEILGRRLEIIENILEVLLAAGILPGFPVLATSADIRHHRNAEVLRWKSQRIKGHGLTYRFYIEF